MRNPPFHRQDNEHENLIMDDLHESDDDEEEVGPEEDDGVLLVVVSNHVAMPEEVTAVNGEDFVHVSEPEEDDPPPLLEDSWPTSTALVEEPEARESPSVVIPTATMDPSSSVCGFSMPEEDSVGQVVDLTDSMICLAPTPLYATSKPKSPPLDHHNRRHWPFTENKRGHLSPQILSRCAMWVVVGLAGLSFLMVTLMMGTVLLPWATGQPRKTDPQVMMMQKMAELEAQLQWHQDQAAATVQRELERSESAWSDLTRLVEQQAHELKVLQETVHGAREAPPSPPDEERIQEYQVQIRRWKERVQSLEEQLLQVQELAQQKEEDYQSNRRTWKKEKRRLEKEVNRLKTVEQELQEVREQLEKKDAERINWRAEAQHLNDSVRRLLQKATQQETSPPSSSEEEGQRSDDSGDAPHTPPRFAWETDEFCDGRSTSSSHTLMDNCWVHAQGNFEFGECARHAKKTVGKHLHRFGRRLWNAKDQAFDYVKEYGRKILFEEEEDGPESGESNHHRERRHEGSVEWPRPDL